MERIWIYLVLFYKWLDKLPCQLKTICIIALLGFIGLLCVNSNIIGYIDHKLNVEKELLLKQETYLDNIAPEVSRLMESFVMKDSCVNNVILMNYHNSLISSNGLAYKHLTAISEKFRGLDNLPCIDYWNDLEYVNYIDEIQKLNQTDFVILDRDPNSQIRFPNFYNKLKKCEFKYAVLYPIRGIGEPIGVLITIYKEDMPNIDLKYCHDIIYPALHKLSILLDFNNVKENYEN